MADTHTPEQRRRNMQRIKSKDTAIEVKLRKALWAAGIRYRANVKDIYGKPDIAIKKYKIAVFCDGSFFHGKDYDSKKKPENNAEYWDKKIRRNIERDKEVTSKLKEDGWTVIRFWDTEINKDLENCVTTIIKAIEESPHTRKKGPNKGA